MMDDAMDYLGAKLYAKKSDQPNAKTITHDGKRNNERNENGTPPRALQEEIRRHKRGDEQYPARPDAAALLGDFDRDARQLKDGAVAQHRHAGDAEE